MFAPLFWGIARYGSFLVAAEHVANVILGGCVGKPGDAAIEGQRF